MNIGLIDVDGHNFPNLALMRISAYHKSIGDSVEWWSPYKAQYDIVYMSKVFSNEYSMDHYTPFNAKKVIRGGSGYAIHLQSDGREIFNQSEHSNLPEYMEKMFPDSSPQIDSVISSSISEGAKLYF